MTISMMLLMLRQLGRTINNIQILIMDFHGAKPSAAAPIFVFIIIIIIVPLVLTALKYSDFLAIYIYIYREFRAPKSSSSFHYYVYFSNSSAVFRQQNIPLSMRLHQLFMLL